MGELQQSASEVAKAADQAAQRAIDQAARAAQTAQDAVAPKAAIQTDLGLSNLSYNQLKARLAELQDQRQALAERRSGISSSYERATGDNRAGIGARLQMLDNNIVVYEGEIAAVGREMAVKAPSHSSPPPGFPPSSDRYNDGDIAGAIFGTFLTTALVTVMVMQRFRRRRWGRDNTPMPDQQALKANERLDRIEQAVDTIAVEIERVSENQRFMTRLMTETQLGASIAAVRSSTELAKEAGA